jgi:hypothetical protein
MKTISSKKVIAGCILLVFFVMNSFSQTTTTATKKDEKKHAKLDKTKVPKEVTDVYLHDYPVTSYESWSGYPTFDNNLYWYDYDPFLNSDEFSEYYVVDFTKDNTSHSAIYSKSGKKIATHRKLNSDLPKAITTSISKGEYKTWKLGKDKEEIFKDKDSDQLKVYKVDVEKGREKHTLYFQPDGKLLRDKKVS